MILCENCGICAKNVQEEVLLIKIQIVLLSFNVVFKSHIIKDIYDMK